jgi:hypothetical protein
MKKMVFGLCVVLVAFGFALSPARAASPAPVPELSDFLASLGTPAPTLEAKRPAIQGKAFCSATAHCVNGTTVSCSGTSTTSTCIAADHNCPNEKGHVTCDGTTTFCTAPCPCNCTDYQAQCLEICGSCPFTFKCTASTCPGTCKCKIGCIP